MPELIGLPQETGVIAAVTIGSLALILASGILVFGMIMISNQTTNTVFTRDSSGNIASITTT